jgi:hypothetical protein
MSADKNIYNSERFKDGDKFNQNPPDVEVEYDSGRNLSPHNETVAEQARKNLERE